MSTGWNLPPGVTPDMLPGNRPEDEEWENAWEQVIDDLHTRLKPILSERLSDELLGFLFNSRGATPEQLVDYTTKLLEHAREWIEPEVEGLIASWNEPDDDGWEPPEDYAHHIKPVYPPTQREP